MLLCHDSTFQVPMKSLESVCGGMAGHCAIPDCSQHLQHAVKQGGFKVWTCVRDKPRDSFGHGRSCFRSPGVPVSAALLMSGRRKLDDDGRLQRYKILQARRIGPR